MKLRILALETSTEACSVAFQNEMEHVYERFEITPQQHTRLLFPMIRDVLAEANLALAEIDAIAVSRGPGSFTGVRIAVNVAKGLAFGLNKPVYAISTLAAMAYQMPGETVRPVLDARMGEVYTGLYRVLEGKLECLEEDNLCPISCYSDLLKNQPYPRAKEVALLAQLAWESGDQGLVAEEVLPIYLRDKVV
jgi:tRNA threonylcarbamoyladenosine biosynthesis protein TsaB